MDGRHARRERGQQAVMNAVFELIQEGNLRPSVEQVGARAEVSVATIFRNYGSLDELSRHLHALFEERFAGLFVIPQLGEGDRELRVNQFCEARLSLYEAIWPFIRFMTIRIDEHPHAAKNLSQIRDVLAKQTKQQFKSELRQTGLARAQSLAASIDSLSSPESWALMQETHARSRTQIKRAWSSAMLTLLASQ